MMDVMGIDIALMRASRESAAAVAALQRAAYRGRDTAGLAADIEGLALFILGHRDEARVAGQAPRSFRCQRGTMFDFAASRRAFAQSLGVDVHHDLVAVGGAYIFRTLLQKTLRHQGQG